jgi:hypothetical protein
MVVTSNHVSPRRRLSAFIAKFDPGVATVARAAIRKMSQRLPGATQLVYDNYNALAIGFGASEKRSKSANDLDLPAVKALMKEALSIADPPILTKKSGALIIKSISARQRPRRATARRDPGA